MSMDYVYIIMRRKGIRSDGYYYESETTIIGIRNTPEEAALLLQAAAICFHDDEKPSYGEYNKYGDTKIVYDIVEDLEDCFWIEAHVSYADNLPKPVSDYIKTNKSTKGVSSDE